MLYTGAGSSSHFTAAAQLNALSTQLLNIMTQQHTNGVQLDAAWQGPAGQSAVLANEPYGAWLQTAAAHVATTAGHITNAATAFHYAQSMAEPPAYWELLDWTCWMLMVLNPLFLGTLTPLILQNRAHWGAATVLAVGGYSVYTADSVPLQTHPPLPVAPMSASPTASAPGVSTGTPSSSATTAVGAASPLGSAATSLPTSLGGAVSQLLSQPSSMLSQPGSAMSELTSAPSSLSSVGSMAGLPASMASAPMSQMGQLGSPTAGSTTSGTMAGDAANWYGAAGLGAGGPVAATLSSGGASVGGMGGVGSTAALAMRGPGSWSSTANVASTQNANDVVLSRIAEARTAATTPATSAGMGSPGMVPPARRDSATQEEALDRALETAAALYRGPPTTVPVVTGAAGAYFPAGEEDL
jgi:hypothetical protein